MAHANTLFLTLKTFSLTGGIEKVCRSLAKVLHSSSSHQHGLQVYSLCDRDDDVDERYLPKQIFKGFSSNKVAYGLASLWAGLKADTIILSHINLLFIAHLVKILKPSVRIILIAHGIEVWRKLSSWKTKLLRGSVEIWAVSSYTAHTLQETHQVPAQQIIVLNNCLDPFIAAPTVFRKSEDLLSRYNLSAQQPVIFTLTRLASTELYKGYDLIIQAIPALLNSYPNLRYILAGKADDKEKQRLTQLINQHQLQDHVILTGFLPDEELTAHFLLADAFVMPSRKEGFGIVFIEAAACGCSVIAGNQDGSTDALLNGKLGKLITPDSLPAITAAIKETLSSDNSIATKKERQALCLANFNYENYQAKVLQLLTAQP